MREKKKDDIREILKELRSERESVLDNSITPAVSPVEAPVDLPPVAPYFKMANPTLKPGSRGSAVQEAQRLLALQGYDIGPDGILGRKTETAIRSFQLKSGLSSTGIVDSNTWALLLPELDDDSTGYYVKKIQMQLSIPATGVYDAETKTEVINWQIANGLEITGIVDQQIYKTFYR